MANTCYKVKYQRPTSGPTNG